MASLLNMSGGSLLRKGLPYDAEIEYLESSGTQYIDTGITDLWSGLVVILDISVTGGGGQKDFFGTRDTNTGFNYAGYFSNLNKGFVLQIGSPYVIYGTNDGGRHIHIYNAINRTCSFDNSTQPAPSLSWTAGTGVDTFKLFQRVKKDGSIEAPSNNKLFASQFVKDGVLVRDYIPVRVGTTGYMYDKVSKQLFGNAGTGAFILGPDKHKEFVDLGLPSGTLWAEGNIIKDANGLYAIGKPTDKGCYFSWGNIDGHNEGEEYNFSQDVYNTTPGATLTGNISPTDAEHDAAVARIGEWCHIPTKDQFVELCNDEYTDKIGTTKDGVEGLLITSKINGNSIFLPDAGLYNGTSLYANGTYWSSTFSNEATAYYLFFFSGTTSPTNTVYRCWGLTVRPVIS